MADSEQKLIDYPTEPTISYFFNKAKRDCPEFPLTHNEISKMYWSFIKKDLFENLEEAYQARIAKQKKYIAKQLKDHEDFKPLKIGRMLMGLDSITFETDEHPPLTVTKQNADYRWFEKTIFNYETEYCVNIIKGEIWTRLDLSK